MKLPRFWRHTRNRAAEKTLEQELLFRQGLVSQRLARGYDRRETAALMGTSEDWVRDFEDRLLRPHLLNPTLAEIRDYCTALGIVYYVIFREV
jgi:hypothetical protein